MIKTAMKFYESKFRQAHIGYPCLILVIVLTVSTNTSAQTIHHDLQVKLQADTAHISVVDNVQLPPNTESAEFILRSGMTLRAEDADLKLLGVSADNRIHRYRIDRLPPDGKVQLSYDGNIASEGTKPAFDMPESVLDRDGVYLDGGSAWLPRFDKHPWFTFTLRVDAPGDWDIISQGRQQKLENGFMYRMRHPQDRIYLVGGPYSRYSQNHDGIEIAACLYEADAGLATRYIQASAEYLRLYSDWIGPYPYASFAIVENRWQTGYGMPSFTLLGSRVIRLPFILHTSLPHEILHNWWGNGVYVDLSGGNWSEGLTAYMSDHYTEERLGKDREYRRKALERYANFAAQGRDFALADFSSRHDDASQAVGYSKSMMLFHMMRKQAGDDTFKQKVRQLWQHYQFRPVGFADVIRLLYPGSDEDAGEFIEQWLNRQGAPEITLGDVTLVDSGDGYLMTLHIDQLQNGPLYSLQVPLEVVLEDEDQPKTVQVLLTDRHNVIELNFKQPPQVVTLDPDYDTFRLLQTDERPSSLGRLFGAKKQLLVMPSNATSRQTRAWQQLASAWSRRYGNVELVRDSAIKKLPENTATWLLGWNNSLLQQSRDRFSSKSQQLSGDTVLIDNQKFHADQHGVVLLDADNSRTPLAFIGADDVDLIALLSGKLPHYSSYGALVFESPVANNILKKHLDLQRSPMARRLTR